MTFEEIKKGKILWWKFTAIFFESYTFQTLSKYRTSKKKLKVRDKMINLLKLLFGFT